LLAERLLWLSDVKDAAQQERGRFLAVFALVSIPVALVAAVTAPLWLSPVGPGPSFTSLAAVAMAAGAFAAYLVNRAGRYLPAALLFTTTALATVTGAAHDSPDLLLFLPMATLSAVALLPVRLATLVGVVAVLVSLPIALRFPDNLGRVVLAAFLNGFFLPLALVVNWHQNLLAKVRREELLRREQWFSTTLSSIGDAVLTTDASQRITFLNPIAQRLTGFEQGEALGKPAHEVFSIVHEYTGDKLQGPIHEVLTTRKVLALANHTLLVSRDGTRRPIADSGAPILSEGGELYGAVLVFRDITQERSLRAQLEHSQRLDSLGRLAGGVAHDFNNLLTVIGGGTRLALDGIDATDSAHADLSAVLEATERAVGVTRQLLAFSRKQVMQLAAVDLNAAVQQGVPLFQRLLRGDVTLRTELSPGACFVLVDPVQLEQVILNLVVNANDAMPSGGTLSLVTSTCTVDEGADKKLKAGNYGVLRVRDTGVGMDTDVLGRIFEPFFTTKSPGHGTGLGLATTYGIVEQSEGAIRVESRRDQGTTFEVLLPATKAPSQRPSADLADPGVRASRAPTILVVEGEASVRRVAVRALALDGYGILEAGSAAEALELLRSQSQRVELLLTDVIMKGTSGVELAAAARKADPELRVLFMSGFADEVLAKEGVREHDSAFLFKPFTPDSLRAAVRKALAKDP